MSITKFAWPFKYAPRHIKYFVGNKNGIAKIRQWLATFHSRRRKDPTGAKRCLLLSGPTGIGKTLCVRLLCKHFGCECVMLNAASRENKKAFLEKIEATLMPSSSTLFFDEEKSNKKKAKPNILVIKEINAIVSSGKGSSELKTLLSCLKRAVRPLICITDERGEEGIRRLVSCSTRVEFILPNENDVALFLNHILSIEGGYGSIATSKRICEAIAKQTHGDVRKALLQLQTHAHSAPQQHYHNSFPNLSVNTLEYSHFFDTYGSQAIYHTMEHYASQYVGKKRGRKPTKKTSYRDNVKTTSVATHLLNLTSLDRANNRALMANALSEADMIRADMHIDNMDREVNGIDTMVPYLAYMSCGLPFALSDSHIPLDRVDFPSHTSTCKRYLSSLRTLLDRTRSALFNRNQLTPPHYTVFMTRNTMFCSLLLPVLKYILSQPIVALGERGVGIVVNMARTYTIDAKDLDFIYKCGTYSGQQRITKNVEKRWRILTDTLLKQTPPLLLF